MPASSDSSLQIQGGKTPVLGLGLLGVDYVGAVEHLLALARLSKPTAVAACNTHIIALARQRADFRAALQTFDVLLPDGMPLVWAMRQKGAKQKDRVYGPYFMQEAIRHLARPWKHFFFGGTETCLRQLTEACRQIQPEINIVGT